jgi:hypothetical protein
MKKKIERKKQSIIRSSRSQEVIVATGNYEVSGTCSVEDQSTREVKRWFNRQEQSLKPTQQHSAGGPREMKAATIPQQRFERYKK